MIIPHDSIIFRFQTKNENKKKFTEPIAIDLAGKFIPLFHLFPNGGVNNVVNL